MNPRLALKLAFGRMICLNLANLSPLVWGRILLYRLMGVRLGRDVAVKVGDGTWICTGAILVPGVTIGENSVVAAGAVVTRDVSPNTLVASSPARPVKHLEP